MISVAIITHNEEKNIERCLNSVQWAEEIIIIDAFSTDNTVQIAGHLNAKVIQKEWLGYAKQKEIAVAHSTGEWVLSLDADEEVTDELKQEIRNSLHSNGDCVGYEIPRKSFFLGKWIQYAGWYPGYQMRLFKKSFAAMNHRPVHEGFLVAGKTGRLSSPINHYTYHSIHQYLEKMNDYSSLDVMNKIANGKKIRWYNFILNPLSLFFRMYVSLKGYKDGFQGFMLAYYSSLNTLAVYAKCWEYQSAQAKKTVVPPVTSQEIIALRRLTL